MPGLSIELTWLILLTLVTLAGQWERMRSGQTTTSERMKRLEDLLSSHSGGNAMDLRSEHQEAVSVYARKDVILAKFEAVIARLDAIEAQLRVLRGRNRSS